MFGSDQMNWPGAIESFIESMESADSLNPEQKRDAPYNNASASSGSARRRLRGTMKCERKNLCSNKRRISFDIRLPLHK
jgi:hypothetical protein